jgi:hypothetical protein
MESWRTVSQTTQDLQKEYARIHRLHQKTKPESHGHWKRQEVQAKRTHNIFNKIITENFPNLEIVMPIQVQESSRTPNRLDQNRTFPWHIIIKIKSTQNRKRILKVVREKKQITCKGKPIKITADFSTETLKARRAWSQVFLALNENNFTLGYSTQQNYHSK